MLRLVSSSAPYVVEREDPRAPSQALWDTLSAAERARIVAELPSEFPLTEPPEGDPHRIPKTKAEQSLRHYFERRKRSVYLSSELPVYYPGERVFAPDLLAVLDVDPHERSRWVVSAEGRGLDFVMEIIVSGSAKKDLVDNVERYARLRIPEYFVYRPPAADERGAPSLVGYQLLEPEASTYSPIIPQGGRWPSSVLDLDLLLEDGRLRFAVGDATILDLDELVHRLERMVDEITTREQQLLRDLEAERARAETEAQRAEAEAQRAETEAQRAETEAQRAQRAESEAQKARRFANRLRELGIDPDEL